MALFRVGAAPSEPGGFRTRNASGQVPCHLSTAELDRLFDPENYLGVSEQLVERVLTARTGRKK